MDIVVVNTNWRMVFQHSSISPFFCLFCSWWIVYFIHILWRWILHLYLCRWITFVFHAGEFYICILYRWHFMLFLQVNFTLVFLWKQIFNSFVFYAGDFSFVFSCYSMQVNLHLYFMHMNFRFVFYSVRFYFCFLCRWMQQSCKLIFPAVQPHLWIKFKFPTTFMNENQLFEFQHKWSAQKFAG